MMTNTMLPADSKGVMVALRPAPGLRVEQALTLCRPNRMGDIMTIGNNRLVLFLSFCRVNDLDTALNHIFPLPTGDIFSNRMVWFEDKQITAEIVLMRVFHRNSGTRRCRLRWRKTPINATHDGRSWRRIPQPHRLSTDGEKRHDVHQRYSSTGRTLCPAVFSAGIPDAPLPAPNSHHVKLNVL
jgi:hypothetical protein